MAAAVLKRAVFRLLGLALLAAAAGCAQRPAGSPLGPDPLASALAAGFVRDEVPAGPFRLTVLQRGPSSAPTTVVYVEGDGAPWRGRLQPPRDPTPLHPLALGLALKDPSPRVVYLARPCQYRPPEETAACDPRWWTRARYGETVVAALDSALDRVLQGARAGPAAGTPGLILVGHSGGGALAALLAARREDVRGLLTLAANLDTEAWTALQGVSPLRASLNPARAAAPLAGVPQLHLAGGRDRTVPPAVLQGYLRALGRPASARFRVLESFDHQCCWERDWPERLLGTPAVSGLWRSTPPAPPGSDTGGAH